ncbi:MAG: nucleoside-diphosphate kinase [Dehalococcoidia bacterium]
MERTLVLIKCDAIQRGLVGQVVSRLEGRGLKIAGMKMLQMDKALAGRHYAIHEDKPFFEGLVEFITSSPIIAVALEGLNAVEVVRRTMGETDPAKAQPGTIRGDLALDIGRNLVHGSDSRETAEKELALFFPEEELVSYDRSVEPWVTEDKAE